MNSMLCYGRSFTVQKKGNNKRKKKKNNNNKKREKYREVEYITRSMISFKLELRKRNTNKQL